MDNFDGPLGAVKLWFANRRERNLLEFEGHRAERMSAALANRVLETTVRMVEPENDGFIPLGASTSEEGRGLDVVNADELRKQARHAEYRDEILGGYLRTMKRFVIGRGPSFTPETENEELNERLSAWWEKFKILNRWNELEDEIPARAWRDGEVFQRDFVQKRDGPIQFTLTNEQRVALLRLGVTTRDLRSREVPRGMTLIRFVDPSKIRDPQGVFPHGIVTAANDAGTVLGFIMAEEASADRGKFISVSEMKHWKVNVDSDVLRGRSSLEPLLKRAKEFKDWVHNRLLLNLARTALVLVKNIEGTNTQASTLRGAQASQRENTTNDRLQRMMRAGTTVTAKGVKYELLSPNLQASDAQHDGRMLQLTMAAATGMPEGIMSGDWSNQNFASALVAQGPAYREFESWQDYWTPRYQEIYRTVMVHAARHGAIEGLSVEMATELEVTVEWPDIEVRDELGHAQANQIRKNNGVLSKQTWMIDDGRDPEVEMERVREERDEDMEFGIGLFGPPSPFNPPDDDEEEDDS